MTTAITVFGLKKVFVSYTDNLKFFYFLLTKIEYEMDSFNLSFFTGTPSIKNFCNHCGISFWVFLPYFGTIQIIVFFFFFSQSQPFKYF